MKKKARKKKVRKMDSYAMGSGNTGVVKNYYPDPNQVFRQDEINMKKAQSEAASNPFVVGLDMAGGIMQQAGMSMIGGGMKEMKAQDKMADTATDIIGGITNAGLFAMGTGPMGTGAKVNAEDGEIVEAPGGEPKELKGKKHSEGGEDIVVPKGTKIFSDQLKVDGKTMADRKKARERKLKKAQRALDRDKTDMIAKETFRKTKEAFDYEEQADLMAQGFARQLDEVYEAAFGTGPEGVEQYNLGTGWEGIKEGVTEFASGFTPGDLTAMAGTLYSGISPVLQAKKVAADDQVNPNYYEGYGQDALSTIEDAGSAIKGQQAQAKKAVQSNRTTAVAQARANSRGVNTARAQMLGVDANVNKAMGDIYSNFSKMMMENLYKKAGLQTDIDKTVMTGAKEADIANRMDADAAATNLGVAKSSMGQAIQMMGKDLNTNKRSQILANLANNLSKYGLIVDNDGNIKKGE